MTAVDMAARLPEPDVLERRCRAVAMLDALISPSELSRRYFFADAWTKEGRLASMSEARGTTTPWLSYRWAPSSADSTMNRR